MNGEPREGIRQEIQTLYLTGTGRYPGPPGGVDSSGLPNAPWDQAGASRRGKKTRGLVSGPSRWNGEKFRLSAVGFREIAKRTEATGRLRNPLHCVSLSSSRAPNTMPVKLEALPHGGHQLTIDGNPFLCRAGEVQNSSFSSPSFMREIWPRLVEGNINTVLGAVCWEDIEPREGEFHFDLLDEVIFGAREHDVKLVLLWFGSHKNGEVLFNLETNA